MVKSQTDMILLESYAFFFLAWLAKSPIFICVALVFAVIYSGFGIGSFIGGFILGLVVIGGMPLYTRRALVFRESGIWTAVLPTLWPSITRMKLQDRVADYDEIARWTISKAALGYNLRIDLRERGHLQFRFRRSKLEMELIHQQIAYWLPIDKVYSL